MRLPALSLLLTALAGAQAPPLIVAGKVASVAGGRLVVSRAPGASLLLYADAASQIWRGRTTNQLSILQPGDEVVGRYRKDAGGRLVIINLEANVAHVTGHIISVAGSAFEVDQNYDADPQSAYQRQKRLITFDGKTNFEESAREDLRAGRDVDIIGLKVGPLRVQATRITVYERKVPVRMPPGGRVTLPDGTIRNRK